MSNSIEILNYPVHAQLKVITGRGAEYGENINNIPVLIHELKNLAHEYPLCFMKDPDTGQFNLYSLLGFAPEENLYLDKNIWDANYIPLHIQRQPFIVGRHHTTENAEKPSKARNDGFISINTQSKRISHTQGEPLFNSDGTPTAYLNSINELLSQLTPSEILTKAFITQLLNHQLLEAARINIAFNDGSIFSYEGIYTVNTDRLNSLSEKEINQLKEQHFLAPIQLIIHSLKQFQRLIDLKNNRLQGKKNETA
ncbi:SapC family protein [Cellvibrio sp. pealriver]|uniref:SapC family protein n=1 Tax=Cellvibrio sp. pealriver TaxID=1622269 RepID=UPI00066FCDE4|nr:SapC family protein [Cellvibrio sp. pealriver]